MQNRLAWLDVTRLVAMAPLRRLMGSKVVYVVGDNRNPSACQPFAVGSKKVIGRADLVRCFVGLLRQASSAEPKHIPLIAWKESAQGW